jgi:hypothetical protein
LLRPPFSSAMMATPSCVTFSSAVCAGLG